MATLTNCCFFTGISRHQVKLYRFLTSMANVTFYFSGTFKLAILQWFLLVSITVGHTFGLACWLWRLVFQDCYLACIVISSACRLGCLVVLICKLIMDYEIFDVLIEGCSFHWEGGKKMKNRVMLAKQGWRLVSKHSLIAKLLKARYFKHRSFLLQSMVITIILYLVKSFMGAWFLERSI